MIENLKPIYNRVLKPFAKSPLMRGISPNFITFIGFIFIVISAYFTGVGKWRTAFAMGILGGIMDGLDGVVARVNGKESLFGSIFDSVMDRLTEIVWFVGIMYYYIEHTEYGTMVLLAIVVAMSGSVCVSYVRARGEGAGLTCSGGILLRTERLMALGILLLLGPKIMVWGLWGVATLAYITVIQRLIILRKMCK